MKKPNFSNNHKDKTQSSSSSTQSAAADNNMLVKDEDDEDEFFLDNKSLARRETRVINSLRIAVLCFLLAITAILSTSIYLYTRNDERNEFEVHFQDAASQIIEAFSRMVQQNLEASAALSSDITSFALAHQNIDIDIMNNNNSNNITSNSISRGFPFVTLPDFELKGSHLRALSGSHVVHWMPLVSDEDRDAWEEYAFQQRHQIDEAFENDLQYRSQQDSEIGSHRNNHTTVRRQALFSQRKDDYHHRVMEQEEPSVPEPPVMSLEEDGTGYHRRIWSQGAITPEGDEAEGTGPFLPLWQRSPIDGSRQRVLNMNFANSRAFQRDLIETMTREQKAILNNAAIPIPQIMDRLRANLKVSQYREHVEDYVDGLSTFLAYPVFDSFDSDRQLAGVLATNLYWKVLLSRLLPSSSQGIILVVENSMNQTFSYRIDGPGATFMGMGDLHDAKYDDMENSIHINEFLKTRATPESQGYNTVLLSDDKSYKIRVFPSEDMEEEFITMQPIIYTLVTICFFALTSVLFMMFSCFVERRQHLMLEKIVDNAKKAALAERELNEFISHEVRNPLSAAISACSFISTTVNDPQSLPNAATRKEVNEDLHIVHSSLSFINDFLRSMLDGQRANGNRIKIEKVPTDILQDILEPVAAIIGKRASEYEVIVDCPKGLVVFTDPLRLKQVVLNLVRNSSKFVEQGFLCMKAKVIEQQVILYVNDSGPGVPKEKKSEIFTKFQTSLDVLHQGTGLGLSLCKKLMISMGGDVWLDDDYKSGVPGCPGASFVLQLNAAPIDIESALPLEGETTKAVDDTSQTANIARQGSSQKQAQHSGRNEDGGAIFKPEPQASSARLPSKLSILFVDDDVTLRKLFVRAVSRVQPSWRIDEASSGETALKICETQTYDLIFLDQYMASIDKQLLGTETAQAMRSQGITSIIVGLSANNMHDQFIGAGASAFLLKPFPCKQDELTVVLVELLKDSNAGEGI